MQTTSATLFISIGLVVFGICYYYFTTRYKERIAIIEKGLPPDHFKENTNYLPFILLLGIVSIGIGLGIITGAVLQSFLVATLKGFILPCCIFIFTGISLLISYFILRSIIKKKLK